MTIAASLNSTVTSIVSPAMKTPFAPWASPPTVTPVTAGPEESTPPPSTLKAAALLTAWLPRPSVALRFEPSRIVPPFRVSAAAPMSIPSVSASVATTV